LILVDSSVPNDYYNYTTRYFYFHVHVFNTQEPITTNLMDHYY